MRFSIISKVAGTCLLLALGSAQAETVVLDLPQSTNRALDAAPRVLEKQQLVQAKIRGHNT